MTKSEKISALIAKDCLGCFSSVFGEPKYLANGVGVWACPWQAGSALAVCLDTARAYVMSNHDAGPNYFGDLVSCFAKSTGQKADSANRSVTESTVLFSLQQGAAE